MPTAHFQRAHVPRRTGTKPKTPVPDLLLDWQRSVVDAAAREAARQEMWPDVEIALDTAEQQRGEPLDDEEREVVIEELFVLEQARFDALGARYLAQFSQQPERTIQRALLEHRPRIAQRRDPFTPVAQRDALARAREIVLWESATAMVLADLLSPAPKALVVPKQPAMLPPDASKATLDELALLGAHVADAFTALTGAPPARVWVSPPHDVAVKQLHVHVTPDLPDWRSFFDVAGEPVRAIEAMRDPAVRAQMHAFFRKLAHALEQRLGPGSGLGPAGP